jgi:sn-glycerol 3-phosphate transport system substrate-binding protein
VGLAGCTGGGGNGNGGGGSGGDGGDGGSSGDGGDGASSGNSGNGGETTLQFWHIFGDVLGGHLEDIVSTFNDRDNGITVELTSKGGYTPTFQATMSAVNAGNAPHIGHFSTGDGVAAIASDQFVPVSDLLGDRIDFQERFIPPLTDYFKFPGSDKFFSMPMNNSTAIMNYNRDMFEEAGLDPDSPPRTFAEVRQVSEQLVSETQAEHGCAWANVRWFVGQWHGWNDSFMYDMENGRQAPQKGPSEIYFDREPARSIYSWWKGMLDDGLYMPTQQGWGDASGAAMQSWKVGITLGSTAGLGRTATIAEEASEPFELGAAPLFSPTEDRFGNRIGGGSLFVPKQALQSDAEEQAVVEFFDWITGPEPQAEWFKRTGYFPINSDSRSLLEEEGFFEENPAWTAGFRSLEESETGPTTRMSIVPQLPKINQDLMDTWTSMRQGTPVDEVLASQKQAIDEILQDNR